MKKTTNQYFKYHTSTNKLHSNQINSLSYFSFTDKLKYKYGIIGGGIAGCAAAYSLTNHLNEKDVILLEQNKLTSGTTWHAAGLVIAARYSKGQAELIKESQKVMESFVDKNGNSLIGYKKVGSMNIARNHDVLRLIKRVKLNLDELGIESYLLTPKEAVKINPILDPSTFLSALYAPNDAIVNPVDVTLHYAKLAKEKGATILEETEVIDFELENFGTNGAKKVTKIKTHNGKEIEVEKLLVCAGMWNNQLLKKTGNGIPIGLATHQYTVFDKVEGVDLNKTPTVFNFQEFTYIKNEVGGLAIGTFEQSPFPESWNRIENSFYPKDLIFELCQDSDVKNEVGLEAAMEIVPNLEKSGIKYIVHGPDSHSWDVNFIMGKMPLFDNLFCAGGFNSSGIVMSGGIGLILAEQMKNGIHKSLRHDFVDVEPMRFHLSLSHNTELCELRAKESYGDKQGIQFNGRDLAIGRNIRLSALHNILFNKKNGVRGPASFSMERPSFFMRENNPDFKDYKNSTTNRVTNSPDYINNFQQETLSWNKEETNWFYPHIEEVNNVRNNVGVIDLSSYGKIKVAGKDALRLLEYLCTSNMDREINSLTYTCMLNNIGGIESDLTIARLAVDEFYLVTASGGVLRDYDHIIRHAKDYDVEITDISDDIAIISVQGPKSRDVLNELLKRNTNSTTTTNNSHDPNLIDLTNNSFPFGTCKYININSINVLFERVSFCGTLGWELHTPRKHVETIYNLVFEAGQSYNIQDFGFRAQLAMRAEKKYVLYGVEANPLENPISAGLSFTVNKLKTNTEFIGRDMVSKIKKEGVFRKLCCFVLDEYKNSNGEIMDVSIWGNEKIYRNNVLVGYLISALYSPTLENNIGMAYITNPKCSHNSNDSYSDSDFYSNSFNSNIVNNEYLNSGDYQIEIESNEFDFKLTRLNARMSISALLDPKNEAMKI